MKKHIRSLSKQMIIPELFLIITQLCSKGPSLQVGTNIILHTDCLQHSYTPVFIVDLFAGFV